MSGRKSLCFIASTDLVKNRFVTINHAAGTVTYTGAGLKPDGIVHYGVDAGQPVDIFPLLPIGEFWITAGAGITKGDALEVGADGKAITLNLGVKAGYAIKTLVTGEEGVAYYV